MNKLVQITPKDMVAVALQPLTAGEGERLAQFDSAAVVQNRQEQIELLLFR